jgi:hypothetical protein
VGFMIIALFGCIFDGGYHRVKFAKREHRIMGLKRAKFHH